MTPELGHAVGVMHTTYMETRELRGQQVRLLTRAPGEALVSGADWARVTGAPYTLLQEFAYTAHGHSVREFGTYWWGLDLAMAHAEHDAALCEWLVDAALDLPLPPADLYSGFLLLAGDDDTLFFHC